METWHRLVDKIFPLEHFRNSEIVWTFRTIAQVPKDGRMVATITDVGVIQLPRGHPGPDARTELQYLAF